MKWINVKWEWTVPNVLSLIRIALLPVFAVLYLCSAAHPALLWWAFAVVVVSGLTDLFDGWIARRFNQISEAGKLLDPLADKLTQLTVVICLATRFQEVVWLMSFCLAKEVAQVVGGLLLLHRGDEVRGSQWFGKVCTFVFYSAMAAIVLFDDMPQGVRIGLVVLVGVLMLVTFLGYLSTYIGARKSLKE
ncbi:MAG: CDP-alcohol phosphatidyltransferase family protein [Ruminococcaceae bacterium]|nr:CDP-alcohol phosphatidyltransferase family protein [Oscillospiraceae bacterium]